MSKRQGVPPLADWFRLAAGLGEFLARPVTPAAASAGIRRRLDERETSFLDLAERAIYGIPSSPLRALLLWAGCELGDLVTRVRARGLEATLLRFTVACILAFVVTSVVAAFTTH